VVTSDRGRDTHAAGDVHAEDHRDVLGLAHAFFIMYLGSGLQYVVDSLSLGALFGLNVDLILCEAKFAIPYLSNIFNLLSLRVLVEDGLAGLAKHGVASCELARVLQAAHVDQKYICVDLLPVLGLFLFPQELFSFGIQIGRS
jgi:hypothetical protein